MTADEIREVQRCLLGKQSLGEAVAHDKYLDVLQPMIGLEIAAQLAELNANLNRLSVDDIGALLVNGQVHGR